jgi:hypothetical protein
MGIKEILAAKKAAAAKLETSVPPEDSVPKEAATTPPDIPPETDEPETEEDSGEADSEEGYEENEEDQEEEAAQTQTVPELVKEEPSIIQSTAPMSFPERMKLKKKLEEEAKAKTVSFGSDAPKLEGTPAKTVIVTAGAPNKVVSIAPQESADNSSIHEEISIEAEQAYADIKARIDQLVELSEEPLVNAMSELKKSLMKNPSAVSLMLDSDIGQMVIALRKMTHTDATEVAKPGKRGPKAKQISLTADDMEAAFDSL